MVHTKQKPLFARQTHSLPSALHCCEHCPPGPHGGLFPHPAPEAAKAGVWMLMTTGVAQAIATPAPTLFRAVRREMPFLGSWLASSSIVIPSRPGRVHAERTRQARQAPPCVCSVRSEARLRAILLRSGDREAPFAELAAPDEDVDGCGFVLEPGAQVELDRYRSAEPVLHEVIEEFREGKNALLIDG